MKVLLLGHTGFAGKAVAEILRSRCALSTASLSAGTDLCDAQATEGLLRQTQPEVIVNCAAKVGSLNYVKEYAADVCHANMLMLLGLYRAVAACCPGAVIVQPVANCAYPGGAQECLEEDGIWDGPLHPSVASYGSTRRMALVLADCYRWQYGVRSVCLITPNMYGPGDSTDPNKAHALNALAAKLVRARSENSALEVWGTGKAVREWLYVRDFARVIGVVIAGLPGRLPDAPVNIGQKHGLSMRELVDALAQATGFAGKITYKTDMPDGAPIKVMGCSRFTACFPDFVFTPMPEGLAATVAYYEQLYPF